MHDSSTTRHQDGLRIIAAGAVVVLHYSDYFKDDAIGRFMVAHTWHFNLFVDLFFVVSGFVIARQYFGRVNDAASIGRFLWRRLARIYPLHLATLAFYMALAGALHFGAARTDNPARYPLSDLPAQFLLLHAFIGERLTFNFPSWSLSAEMFCYLLFPAVALIAQRRKEASLRSWPFRARQLPLGMGSRNDAVGRLDQPGWRLQGAACLQPRHGLLSVSRPDRPLARNSRRAGSIIGSVHRARLPGCRR